MTPRTATVAGLGSGAAVAVLLLVAFVALVPPPAATRPAPSSTPPASAVALQSAGPTGSPPITPQPSLIVSGFHIGQPAPPLVLPQLGGGAIDLASLAGQPIWVNFMATYAPASRGEFAAMNDFAARYADTGLVVIAVDGREDEDTASTFAVDTNAAFPIGLDLDGAAQAAWDAPVLPAHFWVDAKGVIRAAALGGLGADAMARNLQVILPSVQVTPTSLPSSTPSPTPSTVLSPTP